MTIKKQKLIITSIGIILGGISGFLYWKFVGCASGTCYIQSNPYRMTIYGAIIGGILFYNFSKQ